MDIAVFRFTLGIPGFDDGDLPKVIGCFLGFLLVVNRIFSPLLITDAQWRSELIGATLAIASVAAPSIGYRLRNSESGKNKKKEGQVVTTFALSEGFPESSNNEIAWATYSLLKNTTTSSLILYFSGEVICVRGDLSGVQGLQEILSLKDPKERKTSLLKWLSIEAAKGLFPQWQRQQAEKGDGCPGSSIYLPSGAGQQRISFVPVSANSLFLQPIGSLEAQGNGFLLVYSENEGAYRQKDRQWIKLLCEKMYPFLVGKGEAAMDG